MQVFTVRNQHFLLIDKECFYFTVCKKMDVTNSIEQSDIEIGVIKQLTSNQAWSYRIIPIEVVEDVLQIACDQATWTEDQEKELAFILEHPFKIHPLESEEIDKGLHKFYRSESNGQKLHVGNSESSSIESIIETANSLNSSDVHIEPRETDCIVRYRIDGHLNEQNVFSKATYQVLLNQIKIKAGLDIAEKRLPQDGRIMMDRSHDLDIRVSILPSLMGEKVVLRLLGKDDGLLDLIKLGFSEEQLAAYKSMISKNSGIVLISGPTGSGKTTTLYATLQHLNRKTVNIITVEDPIEYSIEGIIQVQVKDNIGLSFAKALRSFLRQDPDIIMVGEIRDRETAEMAIRASLTGHLVLSTIHTNSAIGTISRLIDMGIPAYLVADTLKISLAQRLVRKLCSSCKVELSSDEIAKLNMSSTSKLDENHHVFGPRGCKHCHYSGYSGRIAIYEQLLVDENVRTSIRLNELDQQKQNILGITLEKSALNLFISGATSWEEVYPFVGHVS